MMRRFCWISLLTYFYLFHSASGITSIKSEKDISDILDNLKADGLYETLQFIKENDIHVEQLFTTEDSQDMLQSFGEIFITQLSIAREDVLDKSDNAAYGQLLSDWYLFLNTDHSYTSVLIRDTLKRCYIEYALAGMLSETYENDITNFSAVLDSMALSIADLRALNGEGGVLISNPNSLREASENLWVSHGYTNTVDGFVGLGEVMREHAWNFGETTLSLFNKKQPVVLGLRILQTEKLIRLSYPITRLYVDRGGDPYKLTVRDVSSFYERIPLSECKQYNFEALGVMRAGPDDVLLFVGESSQKADKKVWMNGILN